MNEKLIEIGVTDITTRNYLLNFINNTQEANDIFSENVELIHDIDNAINEYRFIFLLTLLDNVIPNLNNLEDVKVPLSPEEITKLKNIEYTNKCNSDICGICYVDFEENDKIIELPCKHIFHTECIMPWIKNYHHICPTCKLDIREHI